MAWTLEVHTEPGKRSEESNSIVILIPKHEWIFQLLASLPKRPVFPLKLIRSDARGANFGLLINSSRRAVYFYSFRLREAAGQLDPRLP